MRKLTERSGFVAKAALTALMARPPGRAPTQPPVLIGSLGGSGTRAVVMMLARAGWDAGEWIGPDTLDSIPLIFFHRRWFRRLFDYSNASPQTKGRAQKQLLRAAALHRGRSGDTQRWVWKHTTSALMLPVHTDAYPELRFVHLIRDGRDMALAYPHGLMRTERANFGLDSEDLTTAQLQLWTMNHNRAADDAAKYCAPGHYLELRYEDLCMRPEEAVRTLYDFVGAPVELASEAARDIKPSPGIGRWRSEEEKINARADAAFWTAMARFGYS